MVKLPKYIFSKAILVASMVLIPVLFLSCFHLPEKCGGGNYYCTGMTDTQPFENPVKFVRPFFEQRILLADGRLIVNEDIYNPLKAAKVDSFMVYDLKTLCLSDTICDIIVPKEEYLNQDTITAAVLVPDRLCIVNNYSAVIREIGNVGPDSARLVNAIYAALDSIGNYYIIDSSDSTIKAFSANGNLIARFKAGVFPYRIIFYQISNSLFVFDKADESIREFTLSGEPTVRILKSNYLSGITAFNIFHGAFMVADLNGQRLSAITLQGKIIESKSDFCYRDFSFNFEKIVSIELDSFTPLLNITDMSQNLTLFFNDRLWDDAFYPRPTD